MTVMCVERSFKGSEMKIYASLCLYSSSLPAIRMIHIEMRPCLDIAWLTKWVPPKRFP